MKENMQEKEIAGTKAVKLQSETNPRRDFLKKSAKLAMHLECMQLGKALPK